MASACFSLCLAVMLCRSGTLVDGRAREQDTIAVPWCHQFSVWGPLIYNFEKQRTWYPHITYPRLSPRYHINDYNDRLQESFLTDHGMSNISVLVWQVWRIGKEKSSLGVGRPSRHGGFGGGTKTNNSNNNNNNNNSNSNNNNNRLQRCFLFGVVCFSIFLHSNDHSLGF